MDLFTFFSLKPRVLQDCIPQQKLNVAISESVKESFSYLEKEAIVDETIYPHRSGRVSFRGPWWPARCPREITLIPGEIVYVIGMYNITLLVETESAISNFTLRLAEELRRKFESAIVPN